MKVGMAARLSGDGFVVSQEPAPGELLVDGGECRVVLARNGRQGAVGQP
jgi:hypothetical protein